MKTVRNMRLSILVVCLALAVLFAGCDAVQKMQDKVVEATLSTAVDFAVSAAVKENPEISEVADALQAKVTMQVISSSITDEGMTAQCMVTAPDMTEFIENFNVDDYETVEEICDAVIAAINAAPTTQQEVTVGLQKGEEGFELVDMEAFVNAYLGGGLEILKDLQDQAQK